jgi:hypothetical protein
MKEVSVYIRNHSTRRYDLAKPETTYPLGIICVLLFGTKWETLQGTLPESTLKHADPQPRHPCPEASQGGVREAAITFFVAI